MPLVCYLYFADLEKHNHIFFECSYATCWFGLFQIFKLLWVFSQDSRRNILPLLLDLPWQRDHFCNCAMRLKLFFSKIWMERNQGVLDIGLSVLKWSD